jgi:hypothetical protein
MELVGMSFKNSCDRGGCNLFDLGSGLGRAGVCLDRMRSYGRRCCNEPAGPIFAAVGDKNWIALEIALIKEAGARSGREKF